MGFHVCESCGRNPQKTNRYSHMSSGDVNLTFANGHSWTMPDMILHYVADHGWQPPDEFVYDVMNEILGSSDRVQTRGFAAVYSGRRIGYLSGPITSVPVPDGFVDKLESLMETAKSSGMRAQTKSFR